MRDWNLVSLDDVTTRIGDGLHGTPEYDDNGEYFFVNGNNLIEGKIVIKSDTKRISKEQYSKIKKDLTDRTILLAINGTLGNIAIYKGEKLALGKSACYLNISDDVNKDFIRYVLEVNDFQRYAVAFATGATIKNLGLKAVRDYKFLLPPLPTQTRIASILSAYDNLIDNNLKRVTLLEELAQRTYEEWFVKLRVNGEALAINDETGLPEGWTLKQLGEVAFVNKDTLKRGFSGILKYVDISSVSTGSIDSYVEYDFDEAPGRARRIVKHGDIIWSCVRPNRKSYSIIWNPLPNLIVSTGFAVITPRDLPSSFLYQCVKAESFIGYLTSLAGGAAYPAVTSNVFEDAEITVPSAELVEKYDKVFRDVFESISNYQNQNNLLKRSRDILLPRLMNGTINVEEAEESFAMAAEPEAEYNKA